MSLITRIATKNDAEDIRKIFFTSNYYMGVKLTEEQLNTHFNTLVSNLDKTILILTYEDNKPIAMVSGTPIYEYNCWIASDAKTTKLSKSLSFKEDNGIKDAYYTICQHMENLGFNTYYIAIQADSHKARTRIRNSQWPELAEKYYEEIEELIPSGSTSLNKLISKYVVTKKWPVDILVRRFTLKSIRSLLWSFDYSWHTPTQSITVHDFLSNNEVDQLKNLTQSVYYFNYNKESLYKHKIARLNFAKSPLVNKIAKRLYDLVYQINESQWKLDIDTNFYKANGTEIILNGNTSIIQPHFLINRFTENESMVLHSDYAPDDFQNLRKIAVMIQLSSDYEGGELKLQYGSKYLTASKVPGALTLYPSFIPHQVEQVAKGTRFSLIYFIKGPRFK
jgi:hypothetical protein